MRLQRTRRHLTEVPRNAAALLHYLGVSRAEYATKGVGSKRWGYQLTGSKDFWSRNADRLEYLLGLARNAYRRLMKRYAPRIHGASERIALRLNLAMERLERMFLRRIRS